MCNFLSFCSDNKGKYYYFNWKTRKNLLKSNLENYVVDSHASIADYFKLNEDRLNKFEYNPLLNEFKTDQINIKDNSKDAEKWVQELDFKKVVEPLIIKPIINPLTIEPKLKKNGGIYKRDLLLLKQWDSVWDSVGDSVWYSVRDSVGGSVRDSVRDSVWNSVWALVWASVRAYTSSFFNIKYNYNFDCLNILWNRGLVPSFDGKIWRIHCYKNAQIVFEIKKEEL